jgi:hypothetical protein
VLLKWEFRDLGEITWRAEKANVTQSIKMLLLALLSLLSFTLYVQSSH